MLNKYKATLRVTDYFANYLKKGSHFFVLSLI